MKKKTLHKATGHIVQLQLLHTPAQNELPLCRCNQIAREHDKKQCRTWSLAGYLLTLHTFDE